MNKKRLWDDFWMELLLFTVLIFAVVVGFVFRLLHESLIISKKGNFVDLFIFFNLR